MSFDDDIIYTKKTVLGYKELSDKNIEETTHVIWPYESFDRFIKQHNNLIEDLNELKNKEIELTKELKEVKSDLAKEESYSSRLYNGYNTLKKQNTTLTEKLEKSEEELERISSSRDNLIRQVKERANQERNLYPKKQHTGYCLISSNPKDYKCTVSGSRKKAIIYETIFQTPYSIDYQYEEVMDLVSDDLSFGELGDRFIDHIGIDETRDYTRCDDLLEEYRDYEEKLKQENILYAKNIRMNGREGYWELILQHTMPLPPLPENMRFAKKKDKNKDSKDNKKK